MVNLAEVVHMSIRERVRGFAVVNLAEVVHRWEGSKGGNMVSVVGSIVFAPARAICFLWGDCHAFRLATRAGCSLFVPLVRFAHRHRRG